MPLLVVPQGSGVPVIDVSWVIGAMYPYLGADTASGLTFWTMGELYRAANEAAARLAVACPVWVEREYLGQVGASVALPERCISLMHVTSGGVALRRVTAAELDALDEDWQVTEAVVPSYYTEDLGGGDTFSMYPKTPSGSVAEGVWGVYQATPHEVSEDDHVMVANLAIGDYLALEMLAAAKSKEGKAAVPEVAAWASGVAGLMLQAFRGYWGAVEA